LIGVIIEQLPTLVANNSIGSVRVGVPRVRHKQVLSLKSSKNCVKYLAQPTRIAPYAEHIVELSSGEGSAGSSPRAQQTDILAADILLYPLSLFLDVVLLGISLLKNSIF
jgi:hypothetical protein